MLVGGGSLMGIFDRMRGDTIRVRVRLEGVDEHLRLPVGTTLGRLVEVAEAAGVPLRAVIDASPDLVETMQLNGAPCPFAANADRELRDGDELDLLKI